MTIMQKTLMVNYLRITERVRVSLVLRHEQVLPLLVCLIVYATYPNGCQDAPISAAPSTPHPTSTIHPFNTFFSDLHTSVLYDFDGTVTIVRIFML
jgi:hypothetical protein